MDNDPIYQDTTASAPAFILGPADTGYLQQTQKWARFLGILGFVFTALIILMGLGMGALMSNVMKTQLPVTGPVMMIFYVLIGLIYFFPSLYLYRYGTSLGTALRHHDQAALTHAFRNEKSLFKFMGIMMVVALVFYALAIAGMAVGYLMNS